MLEKIEEFKIDPKDPFGNDQLKREVIAENLTTLIGTITQPFVISLSSPWGTGKTTFIKMWKAYLDNNGFVCFNFNAWENDFSNDPFISFIAEFEDQLKKVSKEAKSSFKTIKQKALTISKNALPGLIRLATAGIITKESLEELGLDSSIEKISEKEISNLVNKYVENKFKEHRSTKDAIQKVKGNLKSLTEELTKNEKKKPMVFIIDELDRCRPSFTLEFLEKIKHIFSIEHVLFVLSIDKEQLKETVKAIYGNGIDADGYLRRFIDLDYELPAPHPFDYSKFLIEKFQVDRYLINRYNILGEQAVEKLYTNFPIFKEIFFLSLREQEQIMVKLNLIIRSIKTQIEYLYLLFVLCLSVKNSRLLSEFCLQIIKSDEFIDRLEKGHQFTKFYEKNRNDANRIIYLIERAGIHQNRMNVLSASYSRKIKKLNSNDITYFFNQKDLQQRITWIDDNITDHHDIIIESLKMVQKINL